MSMATGLAGGTRCTSTVQGRGRLPCVWPSGWPVESASGTPLQSSPVLCATSARAGTCTLMSPTRTGASATTCRLRASSPCGRQRKVTLRLPAGTRAVRPTVALPG